MLIILPIFHKSRLSFFNIIFRLIYWNFSKLNFRFRLRKILVWIRIAIFFNIFTRVFFFTLLGLVVCIYSLDYWIEMFEFFNRRNELIRRKFSFNIVDIYTYCSIYRCILLNPINPNAIHYFNNKPIFIFLLANFRTPNKARAIRSCCHYCRIRI